MLLSSCDCDVLCSRAILREVCAMGMHPTVSKVVLRAIATSSGTDFGLWQTPVMSLLHRCHGDFQGRVNRYG